MSEPQIAKDIDKIYENKSYSERYGGDLWISIFIILIVMLIIGYYTILNAIKPLRKNWESVRCEPWIMPFAGVINKEPGVSMTQTAKDNAEYCMNNTFDEMSSKFTEPLHKTLDTLGNSVKVMGAAATSITGVLTTLREYSTYLVEQLLLKASLFTIPLVKFTYNIKGVFDKVIGIIITAMYGAMTNIMLLLTTLRAIPYTIGIMIAALFAAGFALIASWFLSFLGYPIVLTAVILVGIVAVYLYYVQPMVDEGTKGDWCFDPNTKVKLENGEIVAMKDIPLNAKLKNGAIVHAIMKISNVDDNGLQKEDMYNIKGGENNSDIIVSGKHLIYDKDHNKFICVKNYKNITKITQEKYETLCCLITSDHTIPIGNHIFHDWEDNNGSLSKNL